MTDAVKPLTMGVGWHNITCFQNPACPLHRPSADQPCAPFNAWLQVFNADAVLHFGTHGSLEFMPGKQVRAESRMNIRLGSSAAMAHEIQHG